MAKYQRGQSGNPGGRPKGLAESVRAKVPPEKWTEALWLIAVGTGEQQRKFFGATLKVTVKDRLSALSELGDRGWGKSPQAITGADGGDLAIALTKRVVFELHPGGSPDRPA